jgi:hypothetical protein
MEADDAERQIDPVPLPNLIRCLDLLRDAPISIRNGGLRGGKDEAVVCGYLADALPNLPDLLLHNQEFDQERFWQDARGLRNVVPPQFRQAWDHFFLAAEDPGP